MNKFVLIILCLAALQSQAQTDSTYQSAQFKKYRSMMATGLVIQAVGAGMYIAAEENVYYEEEMKTMCFALITLGTAIQLLAQTDLLDKPKLLRRIKPASTGVGIAFKL